ncbi:porin [Moraxella sp. ZJ142]|uniref:porin n=1 Tax=Moraxella marmotae TaxID=3344520 RepID=UPI0035D4FAE1
MKTTKTFQLTKLALVTGAILAATSSHAVYNLYKKDGLTLDIGGQIDMQATKQDEKLVVQNSMTRATINNSNSKKWYKTRVVPAGTELSATDKKPRLGQSHGVSYVDFRGSQELPNDWRVTGNIGFGYSDSRDFYLSNSSLSFDKRNLGAISLGRQYLHTNFVNRSGTDTPLDIFSSSAVRADYYGIKGLQASAYYSFAGYNDVTKENNTKVDSGYGASASYRFPVADNQSLRVAVGYTHSNFNPVTNIANDQWTTNKNTLNRYPQKVDGIAASLEYQAGKFLVAADVGRKKETMSDSPNTSLDKRTTDYLGAKVAYDINPVFQVSAGYGSKKAKTDLKAGAAALTNDADALYTRYEDSDWKDLAMFSYVGAGEQYLYDKADTKEAYAQLDYRVRPNVRLYGRYDTEKTTYKVGGQDTSKLTDNNARIGVVFTF